eukprot:TRINITY_DN7389_c0_g1_i1.p1 TRINITY_DN7389_c0_g1~~TRINITY_DN7389_c0_g1_i1.p1  ORF type:complete len:807 (-),score=124.34 TRINITY_DN7389_c0_g1_i1:123-2543(-)
MDSVPLHHPHAMVSSLEAKPSFDDDDKIAPFACADIARLGDFPNDVGVTCCKGNKPNAPNQDTAKAMCCEEWAVYSVFDGHGPYGHVISEAAKNHLLSSFCSDPRKMTHTDETLRRCFADTQKHLSSLTVTSPQGKPTKTAFLSGTTCTVAVHDKKDNKLTIAHLGDSRAILGVSSDGNVTDLITLTEDHKPEVAGERARIEAATPPGRVLANAHGDFRLFAHNSDQFPNLAMSRALGDMYAHKNAGLTAEPDILHIDLTTYFSKSQAVQLLMCSDGVSEFLADEEIFGIIQNSSDVHTACNLIANESRSRWLENTSGCVCDDITSLLALLSPAEDHTLPAGVSAPARADSIWCSAAIKDTSEVEKDDKSNADGAQTGADDDTVSIAVAVHRNSEDAMVVKAIPQSVTGVSDDATASAEVTLKETIVRDMAVKTIPEGFAAASEGKASTKVTSDEVIAADMTIRANPETLTSAEVDSAANMMDEGRDEAAGKAVNHFEGGVSAPAHDDADSTSGKALPTTLEAASVVTSDASARLAFETQTTKIANEGETAAVLRNDSECTRLVSISVKATAEFGDSIKVVGSCAQLGAWNVEDAPCMCGGDYPTWRLEFLASTEAVEYKLVHLSARTGARTWESFEGNRLLSPGTYHVDTAFGSTDSEGDSKGDGFPATCGDEDVETRASTKGASSTFSSWSGGRTDSTRSADSAEDKLISFTVVKETHYGEVIKIVGSSPQLGSWDVQLAPSLSGDAHPLWRLAVDVGDDPVVEFKFILVAKDGSVTWESLPENRRLHRESGASDRVVTAVFNH